MRVVLAFLAMTASAHADGFDWDPPAPRNYTFHGTTIIQGKPTSNAPWAGGGIGVDHRLDGRVWGGFLVATLLSREPREGNLPLPPLQTATFAAATARVQLGEWEFDAGKDDAWFAWEARAELGTAYVTKQRMRSMPAIGSAGLTALIGSARTRGTLSFGWSFTFAGQAAIEPGGIDVRMGVTRSW